jgi:glucose 1-dehydrogenase
MLFPSRFTDKVCIVTGAASGIGKATATRVAAEGGHVLVADLNPQHGEQAVVDITAAAKKEKGGGDAIFSRCDVSDPSQVQSAIDAAVSRWGGIDVLVNNAAMMTFDPIVKLSLEDWNRAISVDLTSVFIFCRAAIPHMRRGSAIVNTSSVHAHESEAGVAPYASSKGGMESFARVLALECEKRKIRVNCVAPGAVNTPMLWNNPNVKSGKEKPQGAVGEPEDIAAAICFLASDEARFINGTTLVVDGARLDIL